MATAAYQARVTNLEMEFLEKRQMGTQADNEEAFSLLTNLRRVLTSNHEYMARSRILIVEYVNSSQAHGYQDQKSSAEQTQMSMEETKSPTEDEAPKKFSTRGSQEARSTDISKLLEKFEGLDNKLRAIIAALNDEIGVVIGSVQIQDAKDARRQAELTVQLTESTKRQTDVSVRQTGWTVVLAALAAFYLPMTLVTGIYGMNIEEISEDKGPNWWWMVVTWAVTMIVTVGSIGRYALEEWRWYGEEIDKQKVTAKQGSNEGTPGKDHKTVKAVGGTADDKGSSSMIRQKHFWRKSPKMSQHDGARSSV